MGRSYGRLHDDVAVTQTDRFKAAVAAAGISNWLVVLRRNGIDAWMLLTLALRRLRNPAAYARSIADQFHPKCSTRRRSRGWESATSSVPPRQTQGSGMR